MGSPKVICSTTALTPSNLEGRGCQGRGQEAGTGKIVGAEREAPAPAATQAGRVLPAKILMLIRRRKEKVKKKKKDKKKKESSKKKKKDKESSSDSEEEKK